MLEAMLSGLQQSVSWSALGLMLLGVLVAAFFGVVPGLGGLLALILRRGEPILSPLLSLRHLVPPKSEHIH